ncbi:hypothetical protein VM1G_00718 [Cytospora mali]|uniref:DUF7924 domain-containing protein n=1 Tax=Cytospora mali TaxID=578113 RepID=A0A194VLG5_CYTMA|nr:hypothetical protein VM1G_00718 [Valsa mali]
MAMPPNRKRQRTHEPLQDGGPTKVQKIDHPLPNEHSAQRPHRDPHAHDNFSLDQYRAWRYPPEFWDRLSTIPLERDALQELDRRTCGQCPFFPPQPPPTGYAPDITRVLTPASARDLARFARYGGPDLRSLRGYPAPATVPRKHLSVSAMSSSQSRATKTTDPTTVIKSATTKTKKTIPAYNRGFEQHLTDNSIHKTWKSQKPVLTETKAALVVSRPSLSPSRFSDGAFETFQKTNAQAKDEDDILADVIPTITGAREANYPYARNTVFGHLDPLTDGTIVPPKPDIYYGAVPEQLNPTIRNELGRYIVPLTAVDKPIAPNFFLEAKGPNGSTAVMMRQARYDGAIGARAIHSLQTYGQEDPVYDGNAYTYSTTYHDGQLKMYAHYATAPATPDGRPEYHMTQVRSFGMTDTRETFVEGATAFRNARDLAKQHRDTFIQAANSRYNTRLASAQENLATSTERCFIPHYIDRQQIASPCHLQEPDDQRDSSQDPQSSPAATEPPPSFTTRFMSSPPSSSSMRTNADRPTASSKRTRSSQSPPSVHRSKKHSTHGTQ